MMRCCSEVHVPSVPWLGDPAAVVSHMKGVPTVLKDHLKHMAIAGGVVLAVLVAFSVDLETALRYAVLLACPVGMMFMMWHMGRHGAGGAQHHDSSIHSEAHEVHEVPASRE